MITDYVVDRRGNRRRLTPGEVLRDGEALVVGLTMMDGARRSVHDGFGGARMHQPGFRFSADGAPERRRAEAHEAYLREVGEAWRGAAGRRHEAQAAADGTSPRQAYIERLGSAWRNRR